MCIHVLRNYGSPFKTNQPIQLFACHWLWERLKEREIVKLGDATALRKLVSIIFGDEVKLSDRKAFATFLRAAGVGVEPEMPYMGNDPISLYQLKFKCQGEDTVTDAETTSVKRRKFGAFF